MKLPLFYIIILEKPKPKQFSDFESRKQKSGESLLSFANELKKLGFIAMGNQLIPGQLTALFVNGIRDPEVKKWVAMRELDTIDDAVVLASAGRENMCKNRYCVSSFRNAYEPGDWEW